LNFQIVESSNFFFQTKLQISVRS